MVSGPQPLDEKRFSATSQLSSYSSAAQARLNLVRSGSSLGAWVAKYALVGQYLQVSNKRQGYTDTLTSVRPRQAPCRYPTSARGMLKLLY